MDSGCCGKDKKRVKASATEGRIREKLRPCLGRGRLSGFWSAMTRCGEQRSKGGPVRSGLEKSDKRAIHQSS